MSSSTSSLTVDKAESLIRQLTDGLVTIEDTTGEFLLKRMSPPHNARTLTLAPVARNE
jgi:hypothetical protein